MEVLSICRLARWAWQFPTCALTESVLLHLSHLLISPTSPGLLRFLLLETSRPSQLLVMGLVRDRARQAAEKLFFAAALSVSSMDDRASRRSYAGCLFQV